MSLFLESGKKKAVTFSFDDGVTQDIRLIQLLDRYKLKCTFNINSELLGHPGILTGGGKYYVSHYKIHPKHVQEVYANHEVAVHTLTHPLLPTLPDEEVIRQVEQDRKNLEALTGKEVVGMAYPGGGVNADERVAKVIREHTGVRYARTTVKTDSFDFQDDLFLLKPNAGITYWDRVKELTEAFLAADTEQPQVLYIWGHAYEMDYDSANWSRLESYFDYISGRDDIFYGTNREILL